MTLRRLKLARMIAAGAAIIALAAGCGTITPAGGTPAVWVTGSHRGIHGVPAQAQAYARRLLGQLPMPAGARRAAWSAHDARGLKPMLPVQFDDVVDEQVLYRVRTHMDSVDHFLTGHVPSGMGPGEAGQAGQSGVAWAEYVNYVPKTLPRGIASAELATAIVPAPDGSLLRADVQVTWFPRRSSAEYLRSASYQSVTITASPPASGLSKPVTRRFTSHSVVARLAQLLNALPAMPPFTGSCLAMSPALLTFAPRAGHRATVHVALTSCTGDTVRVDKRTQPSLDDSRNAVLAAVLRLLGLHAREPS
jgi:hypothetical protein